MIWVDGLVALLRSPVVIVVLVFLVWAFFWGDKV